MRCSQYFGLSAEADLYIKENVAEVPNILCPHCSKVVNTKIDAHVYKIDEDDYMGWGHPPLSEYRMKDGSILKEVVQDVPWSSGPCYFLCLENEDGEQVFEWPEEEIKSCI